MKIPLPNDKALDHGSGGNFSLYSQQHCCVCGKPLQQCLGTKWLLLTRALDGSQEFAITGTDDVSPEEINGFGIWVQPIGRNCLKKYPELYPAVLHR